MQLMKRTVMLLAAMLAAGPVRGANTEARLLLSHEAVRAGQSVTAGIQLTMNAGWHTYWRNGGDSGAPTSIEWTLPKGVTAGEIQWPIPEKLESEGFTTFVYHREAVLLVPLKFAAD